MKHESMNTRLPLLGKGIIVTRPDEQADTLCRLIEDAGGTALRLPLIKTEALTDTPDVNRCLSQPAQWDWIIFVSRNAVRYAAPWLTDWKHECRTAAIGPSTAHTLLSHGIRVDLTPELEFNSESMLEMPEMSHLNGKNILIVRGKGGREHLASGLVARGASVSYAEVYQRLPARIDPEPWRQRQHAGALHTLTLTSGEALNHLHEALADLIPTWTQTLPLVAISARIGQLAMDKAWRHVTAATQASDQAMLEAVFTATHDHPPP